MNDDWDIDRFQWSEGDVVWEAVKALSEGGAVPAQDALQARQSAGIPIGGPIVLGPEIFEEVE